MNKEAQSSSALVRPPIVAVLGHVDHGKTSLLDSLRETSVAAREAGGITQKIGASVVKTSTGKEITFIDTPGHAAFSNMRSRGARLADIVILVVAADDGVKPQTKEAIAHIREANIPFLVALTKMDLPSASVETALVSLEKEGVFFEGRGGDVPFVSVSSRKREGLEELLEVLLLVAEVNGITSDKNAPLEAVVIETSRDKRGQLASVIVRNGTLKVGQVISVDGVPTKVRGLFDDAGKPLKEVLPGYAAQILGFETLPAVGSLIDDAKKEMTKALDRESNKVSHPTIKEGQLAVLIKTKTAGSLEALLASMPTETVVVGSGVGDVTESDIAFAKAANARILVFEAKIPATVARLAETDNVKIETFSVIYELIGYLEDFIKKGQKEITGKLEILGVFPYENKKVAGGKVVNGSIKKTDIIELMRGEKVLGRVKITSMKKQKVDIMEAKAGEELGIVFEPQLAFAVGDVLVSIAK